MTRLISCINVMVIEANSREENCALLGCYAASTGISLPTYRDNLSVPSFKCQGFLDSGPLKIGPIGCPETSVRN